MAGLIAVDLAGAIVAVRHRIAGEPFGIGSSLDVRRPAVLTLWGSGLSAPLVSLAATAVIARRRPELLRFLGGVFAIGALSEPVFWGRRPCPTIGRVLVTAHVIFASGLAR